ncbi:MAG: biopolymer transporter ExbD [Candidatus Krumholzibacteriota bacterium]|nr:biopolymer transporter ExbD [Candidatus Krumholzibacteriota bacterium]
MPENKNKGREVFHDANMTPLIDVCLVLVVMLLLLTPLAFESGILLKSSPPGEEQAEKNKSAARVELEVISADSLLVDRKPVSLASLGTELGSRFEQKGCRRVLITCGDKITHGMFVYVVDQTKLNGAREIAVHGN